MKSKDVIDSLSALASESRLAVFRLLVRRGPSGYTPSELITRLGVPAPTLSFHLKELAHSGLVVSRREGRNLYYSPDFERMRSLVGFLTENCCSLADGACDAHCQPLEAGPLKEEKRMKRLHVHVAVEDLCASIRFYSQLFAAEPAVLKPDYAKWMLEDPRANFAISQRGAKPGIQHLGIQVESRPELQEVYARLEQAERPVLEEGATTCCYAQSEKSWIDDPQGFRWETFLTTGQSTVYGHVLARGEPASPEAAAPTCCSPTCCAPGAA